MSNVYDVGGSKPIQAGANTLPGKIAQWAQKRGHPVTTGLKSFPVMITVHDETSTPSKKGKQRIMFTCFGKHVAEVKMWLNAYSMTRGGKPRASDVFKANWGEVTENKSSGATFIPKAAHTPTDEELDAVFKYCQENLPKRTKKTKGSKKATNATATITTKPTKKTKPIKAPTARKGKKVKAHSKMKKAA